MSWVDEEDMFPPRRSPYQQKKREALINKGYKDANLRCLDITVNPAKKALFRYRLLDPKTDLERMQRNIDHILEGCEGFAVMADAARKGCAAKRENPSLSKVKQLNRTP
jgi:hypothetical protein